MDLSRSAALGFIAEAMLTGIFVGGGILTAAYMPAGSAFLRRLWLLQAPRITLAHRCLAAAASLGCAFVVTHIITIIVTCATEGVGWGATAWTLDLLGLFAGFMFMFVCRKSSNVRSAESKKDNTWLCIWTLATLGSRIYDFLLLFGIVKNASIYTTPGSTVLAANFISEILVAVPYALVALLGSLMMLRGPGDDEGEDLGEVSRQSYAELGST